MNSLSFYLDDSRKISVSQEIEGEITVCFGAESFSLTLCAEKEILLPRDIPFRQRISLLYQGKTYSPILRFLTHTPAFEAHFHPDIHSLGSFYRKEATSFSCYAPLAEEVVLVLQGKDIPLHQTREGVWKTDVDGDWELQGYHYKIKRNGTFRRTIDPFSLAGSEGYKESLVIDPLRLRGEVVWPGKVAARKVIYEVSVRDFSSALDTPYRGKFRGLIEPNLTVKKKTVGFDYVKELGIDYLQLMPVFSFVNPGEYNWGYNPLHYNLLEESYFSADDPYKRLAELRNVVDTYHRQGIRISLDVVFNHVYEQAAFALECCCPFAFFRYDGERLSNGSYCGNELRSEHPFLRDYIVLMCERMIDMYDIDGLRFDLMGLLDKETLSAVFASCRKKKADFFLYGEGWCMPSVLAEEERAVLPNGAQLPGIAFFDDIYRNALIGDTAAGFLSDHRLFRQEIKETLAGKSFYPLQPDQTIHYIECHDDYTVFDRLRKYDGEQDISVLCAKAKLGMAMVLFGGCHSLIHAGEEFLRTKNGERNTYNSGDTVNRLDWERRGEQEDFVAYFRELLALHKELVLTPQREVFDYYEVVGMRSREYTFLFNPCPYTHIYPFQGEKRCLFSEKRCTEIIQNGISVKPFSFVLFQDL